MADLENTHDVVVDGENVVKRYVDHKPGAAEREWRALTLLDRYAPGLAPAPVSFDVETVVMTRIHGVPLRGLPGRATHVGALAEAIGELHAAVPPVVLDRVPVRPWYLDTLSEQLRKWAESWPGKDPRADRAVREGLRWLDGWRPGEAGVTPVFGAGDGNLANFLWDGGRVRIVDFEESGRSDRAFELSEICEHVSMWVDGDLGVAHHFELTPAEERRMRECRRLHAFMWLFLLSHESPRNPPGTFARQVERFLTALDTVRP
ncbi:aminoglycoside phosphotransferase family protein [Nonomuraea sp. NN258]|uniref:phosphotransferase family protein n=1 Tax=Nonomuraea antri TaxID=2730852 RepID=UPI001568D837|nr:aminoglycoside phosphotransferase family protein [Nonomuraea antri]NRQ33252.1 aminoglycoside phosphotransferase family protein [Nonomuraea antri]